MKANTGLRVPRHLADRDRFAPSRLVIVGLSRMDWAMFIRASSIFLLLLTSGTLAQAWRSVHYPEDWTPPQEGTDVNFLTGAFIQDFSYAGYHRGERALPSGTEGMVNAVTDFAADPTGEVDSTDAIQAAINQVSQQGGGVVYLPAGTFKVSPRNGQSYCLAISSSHVVLRGAGAAQTFIYNSSYQMRGKEVIRVRAGNGGSWTTVRSSKVPIVQDYPGPTIKVEISDTRLFNAGDWVVIHNPVTDAFVTDIHMAEGSDGVSWLGEQSYLRGQRWLRQIQAVEGNVLILDAPTRWSLNTRDIPVVYKTDSMISEVALEDFSIGNVVHPGTEWGENDYNTGGRAAWDTHNSWLISFRGVIDGWVRNVSSYGPNSQDVHILSNGILLSYCRGVTLYKLFMSNAQYGGGGGNGYMVRFNEANECMLVDSEVGFCRHGIVQWRMENSGNVFLRNRDHDTGFQWGSGTPTTTSGRGSDHHGLFSVSNLFDGNIMERSFLQAAYRGDYGTKHGMTASQVVYWNTRGKEYWKSADYIVHTQQFGQGYVIGTSGAATAVRTTELRPGSDSRTHPDDFLEGIGEGDFLEPQSLYVDQLLTRMGNLEELVHYSVSRRGNQVQLEWQLPPGLQCAFEASDDLDFWSHYLDIPNSDGTHESAIPARRFYRIIQN